jgi:hypothetical protein
LFSQTTIVTAPRLPLPATLEADWLRAGGMENYLWVVEDERAPKYIVVIYLLSVVNMANRAFPVPCP